MALKEVQSLDADTAIALGGFNRKTKKENPTHIEGYYIGSKQISNPKSKTGKAWFHVIQTAKGNIGVFGKTDLDRKMLQVVPGWYVDITVTGTVPTPNGDMYKYSVLFDDDNTIEVSTGSGREAEEAYSAPTYSDSQSAANDSDEEDEQEEENEQENEPVQVRAPALSAQERQAKLQNLLNSKRK